MAQPLPQGSVRRVRGVFPTSDLQKLCGAEFSQAGKQGPVYTACQVVKHPTRSRSFKIQSCFDFGPIRSEVETGFREIPISKIRGTPISRKPSADELLNYVRIRCQKSTCHKVASSGNLYRFPHFRRSARWPYPQKLLTGGSIPVPFETICDGGCKRSI